MEKAKARSHVRYTNVPRDRVTDPFSSSDRVTDAASSSDRVT